MKIAKHLNNTGKRCPCGAYHYTCFVCNRDCTMGTKYGPPTSGIDNLTRCCICNDRYERAERILRSYAPELRKYLEAVVNMVKRGHRDNVLIVMAEEVLEKAGKGGI